MRKMVVAVAVLSMACLLSAAEIGGKFAFGYEQGVGVSEKTNAPLGQGISFKMCLSNNVALKGAVGFNLSNKVSDVADGNTVYHEEKPRIDYTAAAYGILVFRRFEKVHLNGMTGLLIAFRDNHFKSVNAENEASFDASGEEHKTTDFHLRVLMAPEIFVFPNFSLEYKYGFDVAIKKEFVPAAGSMEKGEKSRLYINTIGDLNLLQSASVHFYF